MINIKRISIIILCFFISSNLHSQSFRTKNFVFADFGTINIPSFLDTINESLIKDIVIGNILASADYSNEKIISENYKIELTRSYFSEYGKDVHFFWPLETINYLKTLQKNKSLKFDTSEFNILPLVSIKKIKNSISSNDFKKFVLANKDSAANYLEFVKQNYKQLHKLVIPNNELVNVDVEYSTYSKAFPVIEIIAEFNINNNTQSEIAILQNFYMIFKDRNIFLVKFEYLKNDDSYWTFFLLNFLDSIKLF